MNSDLPKVVLPLAGRPMIMHVLEALLAAEILRVTIVVGYRAELVQETTAAFGGLTIDYVRQEEQLGTGHAVLMTEDALRGHKGALLVTNGDMPMIRPTTFHRLLSEHAARGEVATVLSSRAENPFGYGRLVRESSGKLLRIVEEKDADDSVRRIQEINSGTYAFETPEIFGVLRRVGTNNKQGEYYLPDTVALWRQEGREVGSVLVEDPTEAMGANSPEELQRLEELWRVRA